LVHQAKGDKLGRRAKKGRWIGYDSKSNGSLVYFPDTGTITSERNFQFVSNSRSGLEEERVPTGESQINARPIQKPCEHSNDTLQVFSKTCSDQKNKIGLSSGLQPHSHKSDNNEDDEVADLPEMAQTPVGRPRRIWNPSIKA